MRRTLANLEKKETAIAEAYKNGLQHGVTIREHLYTIKRHGLYKACGCRSFEEYCKTPGRLPFSTTQAFRLACNGEVEQYVNSGALEFSERALEQLSRLRVERTDSTGKVRKTHDIDVAKVKKVVRKLPNNGTAITAPMVKEAIDKALGEKMPRPFCDQLDAEVKRLGRWLDSYRQLDAEVFSDAEQQCPGIVKRLARRYSELASFLKKVL